VSDRENPTNHTDRDGRVTLNATEARKGRRGRTVLYVLVGGLLLAMIAWWAAEYYGDAIDPTPQAQHNAPSATEAANETDNVVNDNPLPGEKRETEPVIVDLQPTGNQ